MPIFALMLGVIVAALVIRRKHQPNPPTGPMTMSEVQEMLAELAQGVPEATDWGNSIVDLLKVLRLESVFSNRVTLWREMGHEDVYAGSAQQNVQLHKDFIKKVAERKLVP